MLKAQLTSESQPKITQLFYIHMYKEKKTRKRLMKLSFYFSRWSSKSSFYLLPFSIGKNSFRTG